MTTCQNVFTFSEVPLDFHMYRTNCAETFELLLTFVRIIPIEFFAENNLKISSDVNERVDVHERFSVNDIFYERFTIHRPYSS